ncbi:MAG: STAS domain-containing protein [Ancalomicrobiaceae bacterium]|nr:STAS domain-containing protein [Ancalomicrobiaceae bacterium]
MTLSVSIESTSVVVTLPSRLDGTNAAEAETDLAPVLAAGRTVVIDAANCSYISSAGLRLLLILAKVLKPQGAKVLIAGMAPQLMEIMRITGFDHLFDFCETLGEARAAGV